MLSESLEAAQLFRSTGRWHEALACYEAAIPVAVRNGSPADVASVFLCIGDLHRERADLELAAEAMDVALAIAEAYEDCRLVARALAALGVVLIAAGKRDEAERCLERAREAASGLQMDGLAGRVELACTGLYATSGEVERALECCDRAFDAYRTLRSAAGLAEAHRWYGVLFREKGQDTLARAHFAAAVEAAKACGDLILQGEALRERAVSHLAGRRHRDALEALNEAYRCYTEQHARGHLSDLHARLDALEEDYLVTVRAWAEVIESKDRHTAGHCERVASYSCMLARRTGIYGRELAWVQMGAYLHDVGKGSIPAEILNRPGGLSPEEWARVQRHTVEGDEIVAALHLPCDIRPIVRSHHERWDGYGYPDGLRGGAIPLAARIVCLADVYDALTNDRSFREAFPREEALRIMEAEAGRIFDPHLFEIFRALVLARVPWEAARSARVARKASAA